MAGESFVIRAGRADGGAQPGGSGGWRVKVSSSGLAIRMANWMANWMANYIPPSTDGGPRAPCLECGGWFKQSTEHERAYEHEHEHEHRGIYIRASHPNYISPSGWRATSRHPRMVQCTGRQNGGALCFASVLSSTKQGAQTKLPK